MSSQAPELRERKIGITHLISPRDNSTDGLDVGAVAGYQLFVLFEELGRLWRPPPVLPSLPRHDRHPGGGQQRYWIDGLRRHLCAD